LQRCVGQSVQETVNSTIGGSYRSNSNQCFTVGMLLIWACSVLVCCVCCCLGVCTARKADRKSGGGLIGLYVGFEAVRSIPRPQKMQYTEDEPHWCCTPEALVWWRRALCCIIVLFFAVGPGALFLSNLGVAVELQSQWFNAIQWTHRNCQHALGTGPTISTQRVKDNAETILLLRCEDRARGMDRDTLWQIIFQSLPLDKVWPDSSQYDLVIPSWSGEENATNWTSTTTTSSKS